MTRTLMSLTVALAATTTAGCEDDTTEMVVPTVVELAVATPELSTLVTAVQAAGLDDDLSGEGPFTVFAPVNSAFAALDQAQIDRLLAEGNRELLEKVLGYHVVAGSVMAGDLVDGAQVTTLQGGTLTIDLGGEPRVNGARIVATDIVGSNGVVHLIDGVLLENLDIVDVATLNGFETLLSAAVAADLVTALRGTGSAGGLTVFAPTDAAFAELGEVPSDPAVLAEVLLYHVVDGRAPSSSLSNGQVVPTLQGGELTVDLTSGVRVVGVNSSATVIGADVAASNGVIHVIDTVLLPSMD